MKPLKKWFIIIIALVLSAAVCTPLGASAALPSPVAEGTSFSPESVRVEGAGEWLKENLQSPRPGDEKGVLALLQSKSASPNDPSILSYLQALYGEVSQDTGTAPEQAAWQAMVLLAAGESLEQKVPELVARLADTETLQNAGFEAVRMSLLLFGTAGLRLPAEKEEAFTALVSDFLLQRNDDGGFGSDTSNPVSTARAIQALAGWAQVDGVEEALMGAEEWLGKNTNTFGGFDMEGSPSALASAEVMIALSCLGQNPGALPGAEASLTDALLVFSSDTGAFLENPDSAPDVELTAYGTLALAAKLRFDEGEGPVYAFREKATSQGDSPAVSTENQAGAAGTLSGFAARLNGFRLSPVSRPLLVGLLVAVVVVIVVAAVLVTKRGRKKPKGRASRFEEQNRAEWRN